MKEEKYNINTFIGGWYIPDKICDEIISYFEKAKHRQELGKVGKKDGLTIDTTQKESTDICLNGRDSLFDEYNKYLQKCLDLYAKKYPEAYNQYQRYQSSVEDYNIQKYLPKQGYKTLHCERSSMLTVTRCLVFMTYLNTVKDGGTYFKYQNLTTKAKKGLTLIWPSDFTHMHKGQICNETKYILTGWYNFY